jgi:hypothetical protein
VEVFEDHHQRLIQTLAQGDAFDRLQRALLLDLPVHLRQRVVALDDAEQTEQIWEGIFERAIQGENLAIHLFAALALVISGGNVKIVTEQIYHRQISAGLAVRN